MRSLQHPNVVRIHYFYQNDPTYFYMVLDFAAGGELFERIIQKVGVILSMTGQPAYDVGVSSAYLLSPFVC